MTATLAPTRTDSAGPTDPVMNSTTPNTPVKEKPTPPSASTTSLTGTRKRSWWGDRGIKVKILVAITIPAIAAVIIGIVGMAAMSAATDNAAVNNPIR